ncbi:hypothetical protein GC207_14200 [bacterium]|nr:hypothetical protein [bacterium]
MEQLKGFVKMIRSEPPKENDSFWRDKIQASSVRLASAKIHPRTPFAIKVLPAARRNKGDF